MMRRMGVPALGLVENICHFASAPQCGHDEAIFKRGGGRRRAERMDILFLGGDPDRPQGRDRRRAAASRIVVSGTQTLPRPRLQVAICGEPRRGLPDAAAPAGPSAEMISEKG